MASSTQKLIVIVGATGAQGGSVLNTFLSDSTYRIRAVTRNPNSSKAQSLASKSSSIELVSADLSDPTSLAHAFQDATSIFAVTDWMSIYQDPSTHSARLPPDQSINQYACTLEAQQARNVFDVASTIPTLERLVFSTLPHVSKKSQGKYTHAYHFDSKAIAVEYLKSTYPELWGKTSLIEMGAYLENYVTLPLFKPYKDTKTGEAVFEVLGSRKGSERPWPFVAAAEDTGPVVQALIDQIPAGKYVQVQRGLIQFADFVRDFEQVTGEKARVQYDKKLEGMPESLNLQFADTFAYMKEFGYGKKEEGTITPEGLGVNLNLGSEKDWIKKQDWSAILG